MKCLAEGLVCWQCSGNRRFYWLQLLVTLATTEENLCVFSGCPLWIHVEFELSPQRSWSDASVSEREGRGQLLGKTCSFIWLCVYLGQLPRCLYNCETVGLASSKACLQVLLCHHPAGPLRSSSLICSLSHFFIWEIKGFLFLGEYLKSFDTGGTEELKLKRALSKKGPVITLFK